MKRQNKEKQFVINIIDGASTRAPRVEEVKYKMYKKYKLIKSWCCPRAKPVSWHTCSDRPPRKRDEQYSLFSLKCNIVINMDAHVEYQISNVFNNGNVSYDVISVAIITKLLLSFLPPTYFINIKVGDRDHLP